MRYVILGRGGHAQALFETFDPGDYVFIDENEPIPKCDWILIGIGDLESRRKLYQLHKAKIPGTGLQIMQRVFISKSVELGCNVLVNTGAQIDHDCKIGDHCVIAPGAILCGNVTLGEACFIGAGAIIVENVTLEANTFVPAGTLVVGQDDMRKPQRMVSDRDLAAALSPIYEKGIPPELYKIESTD